MPWKTGVACQRFSPTQAGNSWFQVHMHMVNNDSQQRASTSSTSDPTQAISTPEQPLLAVPHHAKQHIQDILARERVRAKKAREDQSQASLITSNPESFTHSSLWLQRTQWPQLFQNSQRDILSEMTHVHVSKTGTRDDEGDKVLSYIPSRVLLCWLLSTKPQTYRSQPSPFVIEQRKYQRYEGLWFRLIAFVLRAYRMPEEYGGNKIRLDACFTPNFMEQLQRLWNHEIWNIIERSGGQWPQGWSAFPHLQEGINGLSKNGRDEVLDEEQEYRDYEEDDDEEDDDEEDDDEEEDEEEDDDAEAGEDAWNMEPPGNDLLTEGTLNSTSGENAHSALQDFLEQYFQFNLSLVTQESPDGRPGSTILTYFSAILGLTRDGQSFHQARDYCTNLSGLLYIQSLIFLESALPLTAYPIINLKVRPQIGHLEELNKVRLRYMLSGSLTPYAEMHDLRNYGHTIAKTEPPTVFLHWSDDGEVVTLNEEFSLTMSDFRKLPHFFLTQAEELCAELMLGLQPEIDLATIKDDIVNREIGFSFIQHPANEHIVSNMRQNLLTQACGGSPKTFKLFYNGQWSHKAIRVYLKFVTILQEMILGGLHTACGQAPRPKELMEVSYENQASARRNICFWNGSMVYILNHHKSKHTKNKEFYVVRFLPVRLGKVVTIYLIYIRWLVTILENEQPVLMMSNSSPSRKHILFETFGKQITMSPLHGRVGIDHCNEELLMALMVHSPTNCNHHSYEPMSGHLLDGMSSST
ncbi:hypothetical protein HOO65_050002 [Ceratocystis lukuohia]|uniref:Uncharacterized protein n=1 Tax=Ceratocystis lukuohia TaxID=2019550 RepID=A0ABR4MF41_9PEZI